MSIDLPCSRACTREPRISSSRPESANIETHANNEKLQFKLISQVKARLAYFTGSHVFGQLVSTFYLFCFCAITSQKKAILS